MTIPNLNYHHFKAPCRVATAGTSIDLSSSTDPGNIDGVSLNDGDRILLKDQSTGSENGPYVAVTATDPSTWERAFDANASPLVNAGMTLSVSEGSANSDTTWQLSTNDPITLGTTDISFSQLGGGSSGTDRKWDHQTAFFGSNTSGPSTYYDASVYGWPVAAEMKIYKLGAFWQDTQDDWESHLKKRSADFDDYGVRLVTSQGSEIIDNGVGESWDTGDPIVTTTDLPVTAKFYNNDSNDDRALGFHLEYNIVPT
jgi:hypothetical protein